MGWKRRTLKVLVAAMLAGLGCSWYPQTWVCTAAASSDSGAVRCRGEIRSRTGLLCVRNESAVAVTVYLYTEGDEAPSYMMKVEPFGVFVQHRVPDGVGYTLGLTAAVTSPRTVTVVVSDTLQRDRVSAPEIGKS